MDDPKPPILAATNNGLSIFEYYIPELKLQGAGKNFRALFRDDGHSPDAKVFFNDRGHCWCYHDFVSSDRINWAYKTDLNIDDIWRQAYSLYNSGFKYELTPEEIRDNELANRQYQVTTPEIELIQKNYLPSSKEQHDAFYQATDFLINLTEKCPTARLNLNNIGKALKILGFERSSKRSDKYPVKGYFIRFAEIPV